MEAYLTVGRYVLSICMGNIPGQLVEYRKHAGFVEEVDINGTEGELLFVSVAIGNDWPRIVVAQRFESRDMPPGVLVVPESNILFIGAGTRITLYDLEHPGLIGEDYVYSGFLGWDRHDDVVLMVGETELTAWSIQGAQLWTTCIEPPSSHKVVDGIVHLDVMGKLSTFPLATGPAPRG